MASLRKPGIGQEMTRECQEHPFTERVPPLHQTREEKDAAEGGKAQMGQRGEPEPLRCLLRRKPQEQPGRFMNILWELFLYHIVIQKHFKSLLMLCIFKWQEEEEEEGKEEEKEGKEEEEEPSRDTNDK